MRILSARISILTSIMMFILFTSAMPVNANTFTFSSQGDGSAGWTTEQAYSGSQSVKLNSGTGDGASAGKVSMDYPFLLSSITSISFWYRISSGSTAIPFGELNAWSLYAREGTTFPFTADGYFSAYIILAIDDSGTLHWVMSQQWVEPTANLDTWIEWLMSDNAISYGGHDPIEALWHDELWTDNGATGGAGSWPVGWEPLSFFQTTYASATVISVGLVVGWWAVNEPQIVYVDSITINGIEFDIDPPTPRGFIPPGRPVGGIIKPVNKLAVITPFLALIAVAAIATVYFTRRRRKA